MKGSYQWRGEKTCYLVISDGFDASGKRIRYTRTVHTQRPNDDKEAQKLLYQFIDEIEKGQFTSTKYNLMEFLKLWVKEYCEITLAPATIDSYVRTIDNHITPYVGNIKLERLNSLMLQRYINQLYENNVGERTVKLCKQILSSALGWASRMSLINENPCRKVQLKKQQKQEVNYLELEDLQRLLAALNDEPLKYQTVAILAILTGCRRGELLGLKWSDIDFEKQTIQIKRTAQYLPGQGCFTKEPKTTGSIREIALPTVGIEYLEKYKAWQNENRLIRGDKWIDEDFVFTQWNGQLMNPSNTVGSWFKDFIEHNDLPKITFHDLRHSHATFLLASGLDIKSISKRLGHSSTKMTLDVYAHSLKSADRQAANIMDNLISKKEQGAIAK